MAIFAFKMQPDNMKLTKCDRKKEFKLDCFIFCAVERASLITDSSGKPLCNYLYCRYLSVVTVIRLSVEPKQTIYRQ